MRPTRAVLALALGGALLLAACGRRGPPVAPERRLPAPVADLQATVVGEGVQLTWTLPRIRVDRSPVRALSRTEVYRRLEQPGASEPARPAVLTFGGLFGGAPDLPGFERVASIDLRESGGPPQRTISYTDVRGLEPGRRYTYVVIAVDDQGRPSPPSNRVAVAVRPPPRPPTGVTARAGDAQVRLTWDPPSALTDGSPVPGPLLYNVFRSTDPGHRPARPVNAEPLTAPAFVDLTVQNEVTYHYTVQALLGPGGPASAPSAVASATPEDQTPPAQPRGLVAVAVARAVRLAWEAVADADLAGYHVYRSTTSGRGYARLTPAPQPATTFVDDRVQPGQTYYYVVTAVDRSRRANESVPSAEAAARLP